MAQYDFGTIDPNTKSGTALASDLNSWRNAVHSTHSASTAPSYLVAGMLWADTTSANYELKMYDGAQWITVAILDATNNVARVAVDPAETSYITSTTSGQIRHLIASADVFTIRSTGVQFNIASPVIADSNNNELISFTTTASAVNQIAITNAATGNPPTISSAGGDTNINLLLTAKGTGVVYTYSETSATNTVIDVARLEARSTGTPAAGIGAGLLFAAETSASNFEIGARIEAIATDVTATSEDFDLSFKVMAAGAAATEVMRVKSTGVVDVDALSIAGTTVTATAAELNILDGITGKATQAEAEAGTNDTTLMTPLKTAQAISAQAASGGVTAASAQAFTAPGTWTKPASVKFVKVTVVAAGGGQTTSAGPAGSAPSGAGGGAIKYVPGPSMPGPVSITVGAGVLGGTGGSSSFGPHASATGGTTSTPGAGTGGDINKGGLDGGLDYGQSLALRLPVPSPSPSPFTYPALAGNPGVVFVEVFE